MKIAIEALGIHDYGGGRTATMNLLEGLFELEHENEYLVILSKNEPDLISYRSSVKQLIAPIKNRFLMRLWAQVVLPFRLRGCDLVHFAKNMGVFGLNCPTLVTMYDMTTLLHADIFPWMDVWYWKNIQKRTLERARAVIAISQATATDIQHLYNLRPEKIKVIYPSISPKFKPESEARIQAVKGKYSLPDSYLLHVGRIDKKKNLTSLVEAFSRIKSLSHNSRDLKLIMVGEIYYKSQDDYLEPAIERFGLGNDVIFTGSIPDDDLPAVYSGAQIFVYPSLHEGFGLVAVEAIACGTPVIAHKSGGVEEAVGSAACLLDDLSVEALVDAIERLLNDVDYRHLLIDTGINQAKKFSREKNARQTLDLYQMITGDEI